MANNDDSPSFLSAPPDGWRPRTPATHDLELFQCLDKFEADDDKKRNTTTPSMKSSTSRRNQLMSPDDFNLQDSSAPRRLFSLHETNNDVKQPRTTQRQRPTRQQEQSAQQQIASPFSVATINEEQEATGKIAMMCTVDREDKHGCNQNTYKVYQPKLDKFKLYCKTFYN